MKLFFLRVLLLESDYLTIVDLPNLTTITLSNCAFYGNNDRHRKEIQNEPYNYKNTLTMRSLLLR